MLGRFSIFLAALLPLTNCDRAFSGDQDGYAKAAASVVRINAAVAGRGSSHGSGVVLPAGRVVTNCHVTRGAQSTAVIDGPQLLLAEPNDSDVAADLCVLATGSLTALPAQLGSSRSLRVGDEVVAIGFSGGVRKSLSRGLITALLPYPVAYVVLTSAAFSPGASGGGLFDRNARLVGIITFFRRGADGVSFFAIPADWIGTLPYSTASADPDTIPFWMRKHDDQPPFLKVATFEADRDWQGMARAARAWVKDEPGAVLAWEALVDALRKKGEPVESAVSPTEALAVPVSVIPARERHGRLPLSPATH